MPTKEEQQKLDIVTSPNDRIEFSARHRPALESGNYLISVTHSITAGATSDTFDSEKVEFAVFGPRFVLHDSDVESVFPPRNASGQFDRVLPNIILNRATLPWERTAQKDDKDSKERLPWLALLVFTDEELKDKVKNMSVVQPATGAKIVKLQPPPINGDSKPAPISFSQLEVETGDPVGEAVTIIELDWATLKQVLPEAVELPYLNHVRFVTYANGNKSEERSVVITNRLPEMGKRIAVHLVSLEHCFEGTSLHFLGGPPTDLDKVQLISLYNWSFFCQDDQEDFEGYMKKVEVNSGLFCLPSGQFDTNNNPDNRAIQQARLFLDSGFIPLAHRFRQGDASVSWYHGPFLPLTGPIQEKEVNKGRFECPRVADELLLYNEVQGLFDVSYAAAWELGRLLMLENTHIATGLFEWKRARVHAKAQATDLEKRNQDQKPLPFASMAKPAQELPLPQEIVDWFYSHLALFEGVPFQYLAPDEAYLPPDSLRFFVVDSQWVDSLLDGAFSVARLTEANRDFDKTLRQELDDALFSPLPEPRLSKEGRGGLLLRSPVVSGWPTMTIEAHTDEPAKPGAEKVKVLRRAPLSSNVLLALYDQLPGEVDFHLSPEALHFGIDRDGENKTLQLSSNSGIKISVNFKSGAKKVININAPGDTGLVEAVMAKVDKLADKTGEKKPATFAREMIEGIPVFRFQLPPRP